MFYMPSSSISLAANEPVVGHGISPRPGGEVDIRDLLLVLKRHKLLIAACALLVLMAALFHGYTEKKQYSATATIEINGQSRPSLGLDDISGSQSAFTTSELMTTDLLTQQAQLTSPSTALAVIKRLHLDAAPPFAIPQNISSSDPLYSERGLPLADTVHQRDRALAIFAAHLQVAIVKGTRLLEVTYTSTSPFQAARIANAVVGAYIDAASSSRLQAFSQVSSGLIDQLSALKKKVVDSQQQVEQYQRDTGLAGVTTLPSTQGKDGSVQPGASETIPVSRLLTFNQNLTDAEAARIEKASIYRMTQSQDPEAVLGIPSSGAAEALAANGGVTTNAAGLAQLQNLRAQLTQTDIAIETASTKYGPKSSTIIELKDQDAATRKQISNELGNIRARAKNDLELSTLAENGLQKQVTLQEQRVTNWSGKVDHLLLLEGEAASSRQLYEDLYTKFQEASLASGINSTKVSILNPALTPSRPSAPNKMHDALIGLFVGVIFGIMAAFVVDYFDDSLHTSQDIRRLVQPSAMTAITLFPTTGGHFHGPRRLFARPRRTESFSIVPRVAQSCLVQEPESAFSEAYRSARTSLLKARASGSFRSLVVASGLPGEGRAAACFNLAVAFALLGDRVLLLDADMHGSPLSFSDDPGLSDCLLRGLPLSEAIQKSPEAESLFFLPAGKIPANPAELSSSRRFAELLGMARAQFDYVFINSPSVLQFSEASILSSLADGYLLVLRSGKTRRSDVLRTIELLRSPRTALMGVLFNDALAKSPTQSFGEQFMGKRQSA
jgi:succinoglycan biosynthesis transport protein ExoP